VLSGYRRSQFVFFGSRHLAKDCLTRLLSDRMYKCQTYQTYQSLIFIANLTLLMSLGPSVVPTNANVWVANGGHWAIPGAFQRHPWTSKSAVLIPSGVQILRFRTHFQIWNTFQIQGVHEVEEVYAKVLGRGQGQDGKMLESRPQSELSVKL
jgi:hypothetical protein